MADLTARRVAVDKDLRRAHSVSNADWRTFALGIDTRVEAIDLDLRSVETRR
jgi:hypothetical protein